MAVEVPTGSGRTVIVKVLVGPGHRFLVPITETVATIGELVVLEAAAKAVMLPVPLGRRPIDASSLVHVYVTPELMLDPNDGTVTMLPEQTVMFVMALTIGVALIVIVNVFELPAALVQLLFAANTVIVPTISAPVLFAGAT